MTLEKVFHFTRVHITRGWKAVLMMHHPLLRIVFISLLVAQSTPNTVLAQVNRSGPPCDFAEVELFVSVTVEKGED